MIASGLDAADGKAVPEVLVLVTSHLYKLTDVLVRYSKTFPRNTASFFIFFEEGIAAAIYDMRRLQYGRCGELREKALLAPDCCLPSLLYDDYALEGQFVA